MKIIFDSNIWQIVVKPDDYKKDSAYTDFLKIRQAIVDKIIEPYLSETIFTIEAIRKVERQDYFSSRKAKFQTNFSIKDNSIVNMRITIMSAQGINFNEHPKIKKYFDEAIKLNFKIVRLPRIAGVINESIEPMLFHHQQTPEEWKRYSEKAGEVITRIENMGGGMTILENLGKQYNFSDWRKGLKQMPETDRKKIAKAAAEWADADSVAISIGLGCHYFCTRDKAKNAGSKSILSKSNLEWLSKEYGFQTILPEELAYKIHHT